MSIPLKYYAQVPTETNWQRPDGTKMYIKSVDRVFSIDENCDILITNPLGHKELLTGLKTKIIAKKLVDENWKKLPNPIIIVE